MGAKDKIRKYTDFKGITHYEFEKKAGLTNGVLKSGKHFRSDQLKQIRDNFPEINMNWLIFDEGEMILSPEKVNHNNKNSLGFSKENITNELTLLGLNSKIEKLQEEMNKLKERI